MKNKNASMSAKWLMTVAILLVGCAIRTTSAQTVPEIAEKALAATVYLEMKDSNNLPLGFGSGFFVKPNLIATNYHVIAGAASGTAKVVGKYTTYKIEGITAIDATNDLALLKVSAYGIKPLPLGDSDTVRIGEPVYVAGNPKGLEGTFSDGIISRLRAGNTNDRLQMTAPISPGSSGGPVLNNVGKVIGVSVAVHRDVDAQNLNFAIPSNSLKRLLVQTKPGKPSWSSHPVSAETHFLRGNALHDLELYDAAIEAYTQAIRLNPDDAEAYFRRGLVKRAVYLYSYPVAISYRSVISDFDAAIRLKPDYAEAYLERGCAKLSPSSIRDYDEAIRLKPDYAEAYLWRGRVKYLLGEHFGAISDYDEAIRLKPDDAEAYYWRGIGKADLGDHFGAIRDFDTAIRINPDNAHAYLNRGIVKADLGGMWEAKQDIQTALRLADKAGYKDTKARAEEELRKIQ